MSRIGEDRFEVGSILAVAVHFRFEIRPELSVPLFRNAGTAAFLVGSDEPRIPGMPANHASKKVAALARATQKKIRAQKQLSPGSAEVPRGRPSYLSSPRVTESPPGPGPSSTPAAGEVWIVEGAELHTCAAWQQLMLMPCCRKNWPCTCSCVISRGWCPTCCKATEGVFQAVSPCTSSRALSCVCYQHAIFAGSNLWKHAAMPSLTVVTLSPGCRTFVPDRAGAFDEQELQQLPLQHKQSKRPNTVATYKSREVRWEVSPQQMSAQ